MTNDSSTHDPFVEIEDRLDNPPVNWDPQDKLRDDPLAYRERRVVGVVEERETLVGLENKLYELLTIKLRDGSRVNVRCWGTVLRAKVEQKDPRPGDLVGIEYLGSKPNRDPNLGDVELFELQIEKAPARPVAVPDAPKDANDDDDPGAWPEGAEAAG